MHVPVVSALAQLLASGYGLLGAVLGLIAACTETTGGFIRTDASYISILLAVKAPADISRPVIQDSSQD
jgi:hypothetical protein